MFKKLAILVLFPIVFASCAAIHSGNMASSASLSSANFSYVAKNIYGKSTCSYFLGFGGLKRESLVRDAKKAMLDGHPLMDNQAIANLTVSFKKSFYLGVIIYVDCLVSADIVEFK